MLIMLVRNSNQKAPTHTKNSVELFFTNYRVMIYDSVGIDEALNVMGR